jgi:hypothetical protein
MKFKDIILEWLLIENKEEIYKKYYSDIDRDNFIRIIKADPKTSVANNEIKAIGPYSKVLLNIYRKGNLKFEDLPKANEYLTLVYRYRIAVDVNKIESIADMYEIVKDYVAKTEKSLASILSALGKDEYEFILNGKNWYVVTPKTEKAAAYLGVNTEWCTAWGQYSLNPDYKDRTNHYRSHANSGPLYIMINKENELDKYQLHFETDQLKNPADQEISNRPNFFEEKLELKKILFPFIDRVDLEFDELKNGISRAKKFLSEDDYDHLLKQFFSVVGTDNSLISLLTNYDSEYSEALEKLISDNIITGVDVTRNGLEIEVRNLPKSAESYYSGLGYLKASRNDAYNSVYEYEYDSFRDKQWVEEMMEGYARPYYEKNVSSLKSMFGYVANTFETFYDTFKEDICTNEKIQDGYLDKFVEGTGASYDSALKEEVDRNESYMDIDMGYSYKTITFNIENLITYLASKDIKFITDLDSFIEDYMFHNDLINEDYYEQPEYDYIYPTQEQMDNLFEDFFESIEEEYDKFPECAEERKKLYTIIAKYFKGSDRFENDFVIIKLINSNKFDCENGVEVNYTNKKTGENYRGNVKVDNLINYMQIEPLFESLKFKNIINEIKKGC